MQFQNQIAWITGASSGIGEALAYALSAQGARLVLSARRVDALERVRRQCTNPNAHLVAPLDLANLEAEAVTAQVLAQVEHIDLLLHSGGVSQRATVAETSMAVQRRIMEINYFGAIALTQAVLPTMLARKRGHFVVVSSLSGKISTPRRSAYAASKHALHGYFDALRAEVYNDGLKVTIICPGYVKTELSRHALTGAGELHGQMDPTQAKGMAPATLAARMLQAITKNEEEVLMGGKEVLAVYLKRFFPMLYNRMIRRTRIT